MNRTMAITGTTTRTTYATEGRWRGGIVVVTHDRPCPVPGHALAVMHHYGNWGNDHPLARENVHFCPTGLLSCPHCGGAALEPGPWACRKWGETDDGRRFTMSGEPIDP